MEDREIVAAVAAGDPAGIAGAYDKYGPSVYGYCRRRLGPDAAGVLRDTFVVATAELGGLRDPSTLRSRLLAIARRECLRRAGAGAFADGGVPADGGAFTDGAELADGGPGAGGRGGPAAERAELRTLIHAALAGLEADQREAVELSLWHDLDDTDLAAVLDVTRPRAYALAASGRSQLEKALGTPHGRGTVRPEVLARLLPLAAPPAGLREQVLELCAGTSPEAIAYRERIRQRAESPSGAPFTQASPAGRWGRVRGHPRAAAAAAIVAGAAAVAIALAMAAGGHPVPTLASQHGGGTAAGTSAPAGATGRGSAGSRSPSAGPGGQTTPAYGLAPSSGLSGTPLPWPSRPARPSQKAPSPAPRSGSPSSPAPRPSSSSPSPRPTGTQSPRPSPSPTRSRTPTPAPDPSPGPAYS